MCITVIFVFFPFQQFYLKSNFVSYFDPKRGACSSTFARKFDAQQSQARPDPLAEGQAAWKKVDVVTASKPNPDPISSARKSWASRGKLLVR